MLADEHQNTNIWNENQLCHYFIRILPDLYMFRAHRPIFRRVHTAVHTTIGSVSVLLWPCALYVVHVEIRQYMNKIEVVTSVGFYSICWNDARYKRLKIQSHMFSIAPAVSLNLCSFLTNPVTFAVPRLPNAVQNYTFQFLQLKTLLSTCLLESLRHFLVPGSCMPAEWNGIWKALLTFKNRASYIQDGPTAALQMLHFIYIFSTTISTEYFKHAAHSPFFPSKCCLFHNASFFDSCIIHILHTGCAKI